MKPILAQSATDFLKAEDIFAYTLAILRVFDRYGERQKRNKARLKYLIEDIGIETFLNLVEDELLVIEDPEVQMTTIKEPKLNDVRVAPITNVVDVNDYLRWFKTNIYHQKQEAFYTIQLKITNGNISSSTARKLAKLVKNFSNGELRVTINQGLIIKYVRKDSLPFVYEELKKLDLVAPGFGSAADIQACPGTDTCNLGIANSTNLAKELEQFISNNYPHLLENKQLKINISGCFNACGQHSIANIGFHGSTLKKEGKLIPAVQLLLGGGVEGNGKGIIAEKIIKLPTRRALKAVAIILNDYEANLKGEAFNPYFRRQGNHYFYDLLKELANEPVQDFEYIDWGHDQKFQMNIGVGECAGVTVDLGQIIRYEIEEKLEWIEETIVKKQFADAIYHAYNVLVHSAKLLLLANQQKYNSQYSVIEGAAAIIRAKGIELKQPFDEMVLEVKTRKASKEFAIEYSQKAALFFELIQSLTQVPDKKRVAQLN